MTHPSLLLVEDNADDEALTIRALRKADLLVVIDVVRDGAEACARLLACGAELASLPHVVLLDLNLPIMSGLEVLRRVRADPKVGRVPIVLLSTSKREEDVFAARALEANAYVQKSVDFQQFTADVDLIVRMWLGLNVAPSAG